MPDLNDQRRTSRKKRDTPVGVYRSASNYTRQPRLSKEQVNELITLYEAGASALACARQFGINESTMHAHLNRHGVERHNYRKLWGEKLGEVIKLREEGLSIRKIAAQVGAHRSTVGDALKQAAERAADDALPPRSLSELSRLSPACCVTASDTRLIERSGGRDCQNCPNEPHSWSSEDKGRSMGSIAQRAMRRRMGWLVLVVLVGTSITAVGVPTTEAAVAPTYTSVVLPENAFAAHWASPNGDVIVAEDNGPDNEQSFVVAYTSSGVERFRLPAPEGDVVDITFAPDGSIFYAQMADEMNGRLTHLSPTGALIRRVLLPYEYRYPRRLEFGADGYLYMSTWPDPRVQLVQFETSSLNAVTAVQPEGEPIHVLTTRSGGITIGGGPNSTAFIYDYGLSSPPVVLPDPPLASNGRNAAVGDDNSLYELSRNYVSPESPNSCRRGYVSRRGRSGSWTKSTADLFPGYNLDRCDLVDIEAMPGGGAVVAAIATVGDEYTSHILLVRLASDGSPTAPQDLMSFEPGYGGDLVDLIADGEGKLVVVTNVPRTSDCPPAFGSNPCYEVGVLGLTGPTVTFSRTISGVEQSIRAQRWNTDAGNSSLGEGSLTLNLEVCDPDCVSGQRQELGFVGAPVVRRWWEDPPLSGSAPTPCGDAAVIGVRGSGDNSRGRSYPGRHAVEVAGLLKSTYQLALYDNDGSGDSTIGVPYDAVGSSAWPPSRWNDFAGYHESVEFGATALRAKIATLGQDCPTLPLLLVGFSQGADVIQRALGQITAQPEASGNSSAIAGVALLASPRFDPDDPVARGTFVKDYPKSGVVAKMPVPERFRSFTRSWCLDNDPVCVWRNSSKATHTDGYDKRRASGQEIERDAAGLLAFGVRKASSGIPSGSPTVFRHGKEARLSAANVFANGAPSARFWWDYESDGTIDAVSHQAHVGHTYTWVGKTQKVSAKVRIDFADGASMTRTICVKRNGPIAC